MAGISSNIKSVKAVLLNFDFVSQPNFFSDSEIVRHNKDKKEQLNQSSNCRGHLTNKLLCFFHSSNCQWLDWP